MWQVQGPLKVYIIYLNLLVHGVVPILLLVSLNLTIYRRLRYFFSPLYKKINFIL